MGEAEVCHGRRIVQYAMEVTDADPSPGPCDVRRGDSAVPGRLHGGGVAEPDGRRTRPAPAAVHQTWPGCLDLDAFAVPIGGVYERPGTGSVPDGFEPVSAIICALVWGSGDADPPYQVGVERRATEIDDLISYLDRPGRRTVDPREQPCAAINWYPPWLFLTDADGRWIAPQVPVDPCGLPLDMYSEAGQLPWMIMAYSDRVVCTTEPRSTRPCR